MKLLLSLILIISIINFVNSATITFDSTKDCFTSECQFSTAGNWIGGVVPKAGDTVIIPSLGSKSTIVLNSIIQFNSLSITNSIFKLTAPSSTGTLSNIVLKENAQFILNTGKITLNSVSGSGLLIINPSSAVDGIEVLSSNINDGGLYINNFASITVSGSTFGFVSQYDDSEFGEGAPRQLSFTGINKVGSIYILGSDISFGDTSSDSNSFTIDGSILSSQYDISTYIGSKSAVEGDAISIKSTTLNIFNTVVSNNATLEFQGKYLNITNSKIGDFKSSASGTQLDGAVEFTSDATLSNQIIFKSTFSQINTNNTFTFSSPQITVKKVPSDFPILISGEGLTITGASSISLYFEQEPSETQTFIIFKTVLGSISGSFDSIKMYVEDSLIDSSEYATLFGSSTFSLVYSDQVSSSSLLSCSILFMLSTLLLSLVI